jgi:hypothetical protein
VFLEDFLERIGGGDVNLVGGMRRAGSAGQEGNRESASPFHRVFVASWLFVIRHLPERSGSSAVRMLVVALPEGISSPATQMAIGVGDV